MVKASDIDVFLSDAAWAVRSTYHTVLKASPGAAIFRQDMLFNILFIADWQSIGECRQRLTDLNNDRENKGRIDYDYKVGQKVLLRKEGLAHGGGGGRGIIGGRKSGNNYKAAADNSDNVGSGHVTINQ